MSIVYPLRERIRYMIPYRIRHVWHSLCEFLNPRHKWLTSKIPNAWHDKDTILEICVLESLKHYVEGEDALEYYEESQNDPNYPDRQKIFDREVKENYERLTIELPELEKELEKEWERVSMPITVKGYESGESILKWINDPEIPYEVRYGKIDELTEKIEKLKTDIMIWVVIKRGSMWT